jgi:hypothetical protein
VTELATGLGTLGLSADEALERRPAEMVSASPELWTLLRRAAEGGELKPAFESAWANGEAFLNASDGLRGRRPAIVEWKGAQRAPGDEVVPADLRVDHVFLISCKYLSRILVNASPANLFERLLKGGHGARGPDWYGIVALSEYQHLYEAVCGEVGATDLPRRVTEMSGHDRRRLRAALATWPESCIEAYNILVGAVAEASARRWRLAMAGHGEREAMFWRLLRIGSAPYFVLGSSLAGPLRLRIATPWDWRQEYRLLEFDVTAESAGQPTVAWRALVRERHAGGEKAISGHVEIRWSHGRFGAPPEAKVYLDSPHVDVPGYVALR